MTEASLLELETEYKANLSVYEEKYKAFLTESTIKYYAGRLGITRDEAKLKLIANFEKEKDSTDSKEVALKAMGGVRQILPKVAGLEAREQDTILEIRNLKHENAYLKDQIKRIDGKMTEQVKIFKQTIELLGGEKLEEQTQPKGFFEWISNKFKIFPLKKKTD